MSVFMTKDKKELIVTCKCHCEQGFHICIDYEDDNLIVIRMNLMISRRI